MITLPAENDQVDASKIERPDGSEGRAFYKRPAGVAEAAFGSMPALLEKCLAEKALGMTHADEAQFRAFCEVRAFALLVLPIRMQFC